MTNSTDNKTQPRPGFFSRMGRGLSWLLLTLLKVLAVAGIVALLVVGGWFGYQEYERVTSSADSTNDRVATLEAQLADSVATNSELRAELDALATDVAVRGGEISTLNVMVDQGSAALGQVERSLEADLTRVADGATSQAELLDNLVTGVGDLQADFIASRGDIDALGGDIDALNSQLERLSSDLVQLEGGLTDLGEELAGYDTPERELARIQQVLYLFRSWEMIGRARLRISEGNAGVSANDVAAAQTALEAVLASSADSVVEELLEVRQRLILAQESLPADVVSAERDLETAWETLDGLLALLIGDVAVIVPPPGVESAPVLTDTVTTEATPTPTVTETPESDE